jgi:hypothetical protein
MSAAGHLRRHRAQPLEHLPREAGDSEFEAAQLLDGADLVANQPPICAPVSPAGKPTRL